MSRIIDAKTLKSWLSDGAEIALLDVREAGQFGEGHQFFAVPLPYSRFELGLPSLVPNPSARLVLCDDGDGIADRAARRAEELGYTDVHVLAGGQAGWEAAGYTLYAGVNVPSKTFGELVEHASDTPRITPEELQRRTAAGDKIAIVDGRPFAEFQRINIPGGVCCPNGELALRIRDIVPDHDTTIIVNCAGRTRSIIGAQTLIDFGIENPVYALENGTQGWFLAGFEVERGASRRYPDKTAANPAELAPRAAAVAMKHGVQSISAATLANWIAEPNRTTFTFDIRTAEEVAADPAPAFTHAPGGQLIQATDLWVGVKGARIVLADADRVRAPMVAAWLRQLGHDASVLDGGIDAARSIRNPPRVQPAKLPVLPRIEPAALAGKLGSDQIRLIDLRPSHEFRLGHIEGATWSIRPRLGTQPLAGKPGPVVLVAADDGTANLVASDLKEAGISNVQLLTGEPNEWKSAGLRVAVTPDEPLDSERIDFLFFTHGRNEGDAAAARKYLAWETGLLNQLDEQERSAFRIAAH
jgi:rhodanese-related sulfurtransferase